MLIGMSTRSHLGTWEAAMPDEDLSLRALIKASGKTQSQIADEIGVDRTYVSQMVNNKVNWTNSAYFPALVSALGLTFRQVEKLRPDAVTQLMAAAIQAGDSITRSGPPIPPVVPHRETPVTIPPELQQVIDEHGGTYPELRDPTIQKIIAAPRNFGGPDNGPQTAQDWLEYFLVTRRYLR